MAYLLVGAGEPDVFWPFALDSGAVFSGLPLAVVLIFLSLILFVTGTAVCCAGKWCLSLAQRLAASQAIGLCPGRNGMARLTHGLRSVTRHLDSE